MTDLSFEEDVCVDQLCDITNNTLLLPFASLNADALDALLHGDIMVSLQCLDISGQRVLSNSEGLWDALLQALGRATGLRQLRMQAFGMGNAELEELVDTLAAVNTSLRSLDVSVNHFESCESLVALSSLHELNLSSNPLKDLCSLPQGLTRLSANLIGTFGDSAFAEEWGDAITKLRVLELDSWVPEDAKLRLEAKLCKATNLESLQLRGGVPLSVKEILQHNNHVPTVATAHGKLALPLRPCPTVLDLTGCPVGSVQDFLSWVRGISARTDCCSNLESLVLDNCGLTDDHLRETASIFLSKMSQLHNLSLCDNLLTDSSAMELAHSIRTLPNSKLRTLHLYGTAVSAKWQERTLLAVMKQDDRQSSSSDDDESASAQKTHDEDSDEEEHAWDLECESVEDVEQRFSAQQHRRVFLNGLQKDLQGAITKMGGLKLTALRISSCRFTAQAWPKFPEYGRLRVLDLSFNELSWLDMGALRTSFAHPHLRWFSLEGNNGLGDVWISRLFEEFLPHCSNISYVCVRSCGVDLPETIALMGAVSELRCPSLRSVNFEDNPVCHVAEAQEAAAQLVNFLSQRETSYLSLHHQDVASPPSSESVAATTMHPVPESSDAASRGEAADMRMENATLKARLAKAMETAAKLQDDNSVILDLHNKVLVQHADLHLKYEELVSRAALAGVHVEVTSPRGK